jgi:excisionase family DNA binding protein
MTRTFFFSAAGHLESAPERARERIGANEMTGPAQTEGLSEVRFLTVAEVAALMRVSKMTVYRLVHGGDLTAVRVGRSFRVPEHAVHEYLRGAFSQTA